MLFIHSRESSWGGGAGMSLLTNMLLPLSFIASLMIYAYSLGDALNLFVSLNLVLHTEHLSWPYSS